MALLGVHESGESALKAMSAIPALPDVILIDLSPPNMSGLDCMRLLRAKHPALLILICTPQESAEEMICCARAGASGYVLKEMLPLELLHSIRVLHAGGTPLSALMTRKLLEFACRSLPLETISSDLSQREEEVLGLLACGLRYKEIAIQLGVGVPTVRTYLERSYGKLGASNRSEAVARFLQRQR